jgi:hypothetical protein
MLSSDRIDADSLDDPDRRVRQVMWEGVRWTVREMDLPEDAVAGRSLVFASAAIVRRVRNYPPDWYEWSDASLYALSLGF